MLTNSIEKTESYLATQLFRFLFSLQEENIICEHGWSKHGAEGIEIGVGAGENVLFSLSPTCNHPTLKIMEMGRLLGKRSTLASSLHCTHYCLVLLPCTFDKPWHG